MTLQMSVNQLAESKELLQLIEEMKKNGLLPGLTDTKQLALDVANTLQNDPDLNFTKNDLNDPQMKNVLQTAVMGQHLNNNGLEFNYKLLFKAPTPENKKLLTEELVKLLKQKLEADAKKNPALQALLKQDPEKVDKILRMAVDRIMQKDLKDISGYDFKSGLQMLKKLNDALELVTDMVRDKFKENAKDKDQIKEDLIARYGVDIRDPGSQGGSGASVEEGNKMGYMDYANIPSDTFEGKRNNPDYGQLDPYGLVWATILNAIGANADGALEFELNAAGKMPGEQAESEHKSRTPFNMTPKPPGIESH